MVAGNTLLEDIYELAMQEQLARSLQCIDQDLPDSTKDTQFLQEKYQTNLRIQSQALAALKGIGIVTVDDFKTKVERAFSLPLSPEIDDAVYDLCYWLGLEEVADKYLGEFFEDPGSFF